VLLEREGSLARRTSIDTDEAARGSVE